VTALETQPERTALAWQRTGLGVLAVAGLLGHRALHTESSVLLVAAGVVALLGLAVLGALAPLRYRQVRAWVERGRAVCDPWVARAVTATVLLTAVAAAVAVLS
jgi:putative membrane protein